MKPRDLPPPACQLGYTASQVLDIFGSDRARRFWRGHAPLKCDRATGCGPHGSVVTTLDVKAFLDRERR